MLLEIGGLPTGVGRVANTAIGREISCLVVGAGRRLKIILVAGKTVGRRIREIASDMAAVAVFNLVTLRQREKTVIARPACPLPRRAGKIMANRTIHRIARRLVVGRRRRLEFVEVAIQAIIPDSVEAQRRFRNVAIPAVCHRMVAEQREAVVEMQFRDIVHQPMRSAMATGAILAHRHLVQVGVAGNAIRLGFLENERLVTVPAVHRGMFAGQRKIGLVVGETLRSGGSGWNWLLPGFRCYFPTIGRVAGGAVYF
mgnify:CR=1 FL=1